MKPMSLTSPESIAREYGGNKKAIADAARMGLIDPTAAVMAGMFIDRMRNAAAEEQKADTTVAQDVLGAPPPPQGIQQAMPQAAPQAAPQPQMAQPQGIPGAQMAAAQPRMAPGVEGLPTGEVGNYAGGGIVAFAEGMTDEQARALGYSNAAEYYAFQDIRKGPAGETAVVPSDDMEMTRPGPIFDYDRTPLSEKIKQEVPSRANYLSGINSIRDRTSIFGGPDLSTPFDRPQGVTTRADADRMAVRQAVQDRFGLPAITKGRLDLTTPFNRVAPEVAANAPQTRSILPPLVAARPEVAPKLNPYGLEVPNTESAFTRAERMAKGLVDVPERKDTSAFLTEQEEMDRRLGVNKDLYKNQIAKLEEERGTLKADREEAKYMRLIEAGLGVMAGTSPHALVNVGKGASPAMQGLAQDIKDIKKADKEITRSQMALETAENQYKTDKSKTVLARIDKQEENIQKAQQTRATLTSQVAHTLSSAEMQKYQTEMQDLTHRFTAEVAANASKYAADRGLEGHLANAAAHKYASDHKERGIRNYMASRGITYAEAVAELGEIEHPKDRFNAIHNAINGYNQSVQNDLKILGLDARRTELMKDPEKNKAAIAELNAKEKEIRDARKKDYGITDQDYAYLNQESNKLANKNKPAPAQTAPAAPPASLPSGAPAGSKYGAYVQGRGWEVKDKDGKVIGYGQ